jgi:hypothetical protein
MPGDGQWYSDERRDDPEFKLPTIEEEAADIVRAWSDFGMSEFIMDAGKIDWGWEEWAWEQINPPSPDRYADWFGDSYWDEESTEISRENTEGLASTAESEL